MSYSKLFKEKTCEKVLQVLVESGLSQREFAEMIGVDPSAISNLKREEAWTRIPTGYWDIFQDIVNKKIEFNGRSMTDHRLPRSGPDITREEILGKPEIPLADYVMEYTWDENGKRKLIIGVLADITIELSLKNGAEVTIKTL